jgi:hypothetical protein
MRGTFFLPIGILMFIATNWVSTLFGFHLWLVLPWVFVSLVCCALGLYGLKVWSRLVYGVVEFVFGMFISVVAISAYGGAQENEFRPIMGTNGFFHNLPEGVLNLTGPEIALFGMLAAVYVMVSGLDNAGEGLTAIRQGKLRP